jgi:uncharacterized protein YbjT (DUF2867 family)
MEQRTALIFGATGLVGNLLLEELVKSGKYSLIKVFVRQTSGLTSDGIEEIIIDFSNPGNFSSKLSGDDLFVCLGTTIKKAGSVANMEKIDRDLPVSIARQAKANGVTRVAVVSSIGADSGSKNYYLRIKGEMEEGVLKSGISRIVIVRPSMLLGERKERRVGEIAGKIVMKTFSPLLAGKLIKFRAIHGRDVARAMIVLLGRESDKSIYESDELKKAAKE